MNITRRTALGLGLMVLGGMPAIVPGFAAAARPPEQILRTWYKLVLELVRHTATYSPPVASRSFAYLGVIAFEAAASGNPALQSLAGQLNGLTVLPSREAGQAYDEGVVINAAMQAAVTQLFSNTGPTGQRALAALGAKLTAEAEQGLPKDVVARSEAYGRAVAAHVLAWSADDGGAVVENMGFPQEYTLTKGPAHWVPTSPIRQQQLPLLPKWGGNRTFAMANGAACPLPPPPAYSEDVNSEFYKQAFEVYDTVKHLTPEQKAIARFWSDDPMLSPTPPGHWISIGLQQLDRENASLDRSAELLAKLGITLADSFIACWNSKFEFDLVRPITYIKRVIDPKWEALLITPPFPEYPSGHSTQSGAAAEVLTVFYGDNFAFEDATGKRDGLPNRSFPSFWAAAQEAGISRLYGGIHYRAAIARGLDQGRCVAASTNALKTRS
ncbi:MAG: vanadium-dependent haloperoxidase [Hyphomicrobiales bacterium]